MKQNIANVHKQLSESQRTTVQSNSSAASYVSLCVNVSNIQPEWYLKQKPVGGSKAGGLPTLPFPLSLPSRFPFPLRFQTNQWEGRSDPVSGSSPASPYKYHADHRGGGITTENGSSVPTGLYLSTVSDSAKSAVGVGSQLIHLLPMTWKVCFFFYDCSSHCNVSVLSCYTRASSRVRSRNSGHSS